MCAGRGRRNSGTLLLTVGTEHRLSLQIQKREVFCLGDSAQEILKVKDLSTSFFLREGEIKAVDDVSFSVKKGEVLALVGESGSGKTGLPPVFVPTSELVKTVSWHPHSFIGLATL